MCIVTRVDIGFRARSWAVFCVSVVESRCVHVQNRLWCCNRCNNGWRTCALHQPLVYGKSLSPSAYHIGIINSRPGFISQTDLTVSCICFVGEKLGAFLYPVHKCRWYFFLVLTEPCLIAILRLLLHTVFLQVLSEFCWDVWDAGHVRLGNVKLTGVERLPFCIDELETSTNFGFLPN